jgi:multisubunit Na+/H+ antiporter MnhB subunit
MVVFIIGLILIFFHRAVLDLPEFGNPLMPVSGEYLLSGLEKTGAANIVASIILDFRAYDTLGEATVIFVAIAGAIVLLRKKGKI